MNAANAEPVFAFSPLDNTRDTRTGVSVVTLLRTAQRVGEIKWHQAWRCYAFYPDRHIALNIRALSEINARLKVLMAAWKKRKDRREFDNKKDDYEQKRLASQCE